MNLTGIKTFIIAVLTAIAGIFGYGAMQKRKGRKDAEQDAKEADYENARDIRRRVDRDRDQRVRELDDAGWRDD